MAQESPVQPGPDVNTATTEEIEKAKGTAWLSYLGILWLIPLLTLKDNSYAKWHVKQGIALDIVTIGVGIVMAILSFIIIGLIIGPIGFAIILVLRIIGLIKSLQGDMWKCPLGVSKIAEMFKF
jgi:uncharacterized membrane protein